MGNNLSGNDSYRRWYVFTLLHFGAYEKPQATNVVVIKELRAAFSTIKLFLTLPNIEKEEDHC